MDECSTGSGAPARVVDAAAVRVGPDGFAYMVNGPDADVHRFLDAYLASCHAAPPNNPGVSADPGRLARLFQSAVGLEARLYPCEGPAPRSTREAWATGLSHYSGLGLSRGHRIMLAVCSASGEVVAWRTNRMMDKVELKHIAPVHWNHINLTGD